MGEVLLEAHYSIEQRKYIQETDFRVEDVVPEFAAILAALTAKWLDGPASKGDQSPRLPGSAQTSSKSGTGLWRFCSCWSISRNSGSEGGRPVQDSQYDEQVRSLLHYARRKFSANLAIERVALTLRSYDPGEWRHSAASNLDLAALPKRHPPSVLFVRLGSKWRDSSTVPLFTRSYISYLCNTNQPFYVPGSIAEAGAVATYESGQGPRLPAEQMSAVLAARELQSHADDPTEHTDGEGSVHGNSSPRPHHWPPSPLLLPPPRDEPSAGGRGGRASSGGFLGTIANGLVVRRPRGSSRASELSTPRSGGPEGSARSVGAEGAPHGAVRSQAGQQHGPAPLNTNYPYHRRGSDPDPRHVDGNSGHVLPDDATAGAGAGDSARLGHGSPLHLGQAARTASHNDDLSGPAMSVGKTSSTSAGGFPSLSVHTGAGQAGHGHGPAGNSSAGAAGGAGGFLSAFGSRSLRHPTSPLGRLPNTSPTGPRISLLNPLRAATASAAAQTGAVQAISTAGAGAGASVVPPVVPPLAISGTGVLARGVSLLSAGSGILAGPTRSLSEDTAAHTAGTDLHRVDTLDLEGSPWPVPPPAPPQATGQTAASPEAGEPVAREGSPAKPGPRQSPGLPPSDGSARTELDGASSASVTPAQVEA